MHGNLHNRISLPYSKHALLAMKEMQFFEVHNAILAPSEKQKPYNSKTISSTWPLLWIDCVTAGGYIYISMSGY